LLTKSVCTARGPRHSQEVIAAGRLSGGNNNWIAEADSMVGLYKLNPADP
jgi:hypothetical protein